MTDTALDLDVAALSSRTPRVRSVQGEVEVRESDDGPEVVGRIVPFGVVADVTDVVDGEPVQYRETFVAGCTEHVRQTARSRFGGVPRWVKFRLGHVETFDEQIGYARAIEERADGVWATLGLYVDPHRLDKIRSMLRTSHNGLSIEFSPIKSAYADGVLTRRQILLHGVAATPLPQYASAMIASVRGDADLGTPNLDRVAAMLAELEAAPSGAP